jgi:hypothetical protein
MFMSAIRRLRDRWRVFRERKRRLAEARHRNPDVRIWPMN